MSCTASNGSGAFGSGGGDACAAGPSGIGVNRWLLLVMSGVFLFAIGGLYSFSVFSGPLGELRGWNKAQMTLGYSIQVGILPIPMLIAGKLVDKGHARFGVILGGLLLSTGYIGAGYAPNLPTFYLTYGVLAGLGDGIGYCSALNNAIKYFPDRRGTAAGFVTGLYGLSSVWVAPSFAFLVGGVPANAPRALLIMGSIFAAVTVLAWLIIRDAPDGYRPPGWEPNTLQVEAASKGSLTWQRMVRTRLFWVMFLMVGAGTFSGLMVTSQAVQMGVGMYSIEPLVAASVFVPLIAIANGAGRIVFGTLSDVMGQIRAIIVVFGGFVLSLVVLLATRGYAAGFGVGVVILCVCYGGLIGIMPALTMRSFGPKHQGVNYAIVFFAFSASAMIGPMLAAFLGADGDYTWAFVVAIGVALVGMLSARGCGKLLERAGR